MKKLLLALFVMCSALSFSAKVIKATDIDVKGNVVYEAGQNAPYTGFIETYNEKNIIRIICYVFCTFILSESY